MARESWDYGSSSLIVIDLVGLCPWGDSATNSRGATVMLCHIQRILKPGVRRFVSSLTTVLFLVTLLFLLCGMICRAQTGLQMRICSMSKEVLVGEPVVLRVSLVNMGDNVVRIVPAFELSKGLIDFEIESKDSEAFHVKESRLLSISWFTDPRYWDQLALGDSLYGYVSLLYCQMRAPGTQNLILYEPGEYSIRASFCSDETTVLSNTIRIIVKEVPADEAAAQSAFLSKSVLWFVGSEMTSIPQGTWDVYHTIARQWPSSVYAEYAWYYMAKIDLLEGRFVRAVEEYSTFLSEFPESPYSEQAEIEITECRIVGFGQDENLLLTLPEGYRHNVYLYRLIQRMRQGGLPR